MLKSRDFFTILTISELKGIFERNNLRVKCKPNFKKSFFEILDERKYLNLLLTTDEIETMGLNASQQLFFKVKDCRDFSFNEDVVDRAPRGEVSFLPTRFPRLRRRKLKTINRKVEIMDDEKDFDDNETRCIGLKRGRYNDEDMNIQKKRKLNKEEQFQIGSKSCEISEFLRFKCQVKGPYDKVELSKFLMKIFNTQKDVILKQMKSVRNLQNEIGQKKIAESFRKALEQIDTKKFRKNRELKSLLLYVLDDMFDQFHPLEVIEVLRNRNVNDSDGNIVNSMINDIHNMIFKKYCVSVKKCKKHNFDSFFQNVISGDVNVGDVLEKVNSKYEVESELLDREIVRNVITKLSSPNEKIFISFVIEQNDPLEYEFHELCTLEYALKLFERTEKKNLSGYGVYYRNDLIEEENFVNSFFELGVFYCNDDEEKNNIPLLLRLKS